MAAELLKPDSGLPELEEETGKRFHFEGGEALPLDTFEVVETGGQRGDRAAGAAVPGRRRGAGLDRGAAHVQRDDAIARVDSYIVSVTGGGTHVGERRMVRIETVGRSAATAALLDGRQRAPASDENGDEKLESSRLRRPTASREQGRQAPLARGRSRPSPK